MALESFYGGKQGVSPVIKASFEFINTEDPAYIYYKELNKLVNISAKQAEKLTLAGFGSAIEKYNANNEKISDDDITSEVKYCKVIWTEPMLKLFTMDECFKDVNYTDVWYNELCIIDTQNKLNPNNGKIFKRTLKRYENPIITGFTDRDSLYAEYVGQIVGPSGGVPNIKFGDLNEIRKEAAGKYIDNNDNEAYYNVDNWDYLYPDNATEGLTTTDANLSNRDGDEDRSNDYQQIAILNSGDNNNITIVPGKDEQGNYNDKIRYTWCNVRHNLDNSVEDSAWIYLGFEIPYTFWETSAKNIPYWDARESLRVDTQNDEQNNYHPFYHNLTFYIPRGARGIGPEKVFIVNPKDPDSEQVPSGKTLYTFDAITYNHKTDVYTVDDIDPDKKQEVSDKDSYWVAKWKLYNPKVGTDSNGEPIPPVEVYQYLGSYKDVRNIELSNDGILKFIYSDNSEISMGNKIRWINAIDINTTRGNANYGKVTVTYNTKDSQDNNETFETTVPFIKAISHNNSSGELTFNYVGDINIKANGKIKEIVDTQIRNDGHLWIKYTDPINNVQGSNGYYDLGQVKGNTTTGPVVTMINPTQGNNGMYSDFNEVLNILNGSNGYNNNNVSISNDGTIIDNGTDKTGGLIAAQFGPEEYGIFFYSNNAWVYAGNVGGTGGGNNGLENINFKTYNISNENEVEVEENPPENSRDIEISFIDSFINIDESDKTKSNYPFLDHFWDSKENNN